MDFAVIDVETANADLASVCQVGVARFDGGALANSWSTLIDPEDVFEPLHISVHGIDEGRVKGAPTFPDVWEGIASRVEGTITVSHTPFDRLSLSRVCDRYRRPEFRTRWLDSARVVRRTWSEWSRTGYGLQSVADALGIQYVAHDAEEDARAAGEVLLAAIRHSGVSLEEWLDRAHHPIGADEHGRIMREGDLDGPLAGEVAVFTGSMSIPRREAADLAAKVGCSVEAAVNKRTTILVVGDQDLRRLSGHEKSAKHRRAVELIASGRGIRILGESDFRELVGVHEDWR